MKHPPLFSQTKNTTGHTVIGLKFRIISTALAGLFIFGALIGLAGCASSGDIDSDDREQIFSRGHSGGANLAAPDILAGGF